MGATTYTVSDGKLMLTLEVAEEGGYNVTSPLDPQLITQADTLEEAFANAYDAREALVQARAEMAHALRKGSMPQSRAMVRTETDPVNPAGPA